MAEILGRLGKAAAAFAPFADAESLGFWKEALRIGFTLDRSTTIETPKVDALYHLITLHVLTYSTAQLKTWRATLPPEKQQSYAENLRTCSIRLAPAIALMLRRGEDGWMSKDARLGALASILADPWVAQAAANLPDLLHRFCALKVVTAREWLDAAPVVIQEAPRGGRTAREMAALAWRANQRPKVAGYLDQALEAASEPDLQARYRIGRDSLP